MSNFQSVFKINLDTMSFNAPPSSYYSSKITVHVTVLKKNILSPKKKLETLLEAFPVQDVESVVLYTSSKNERRLKPLLRVNPLPFRFQLVSTGA